MALNSGALKENCQSILIRLKWFFSPSDTNLKSLKLSSFSTTRSKQPRKYLGVILDAKLGWKQHVEAKCKKSLRRVTSKTVLWLYTAITRPYIRLILKTAVYPQC